MNYQLVTPGTLEIVSLAEAKIALQLPTNYSASDDLINDYIETAISYIEDKTNRVLRTSTWKGFLDSFSEVITINKNPITAVASITYYDGDNVEQTLSTSDYFTDFVSEPSRVYIEDFPTSIYLRPNAITINFTAGYTTASDVKAQAKQAIRQLIRHYYDNRGVASPVQLYDIPEGVKNLINQLRIDQL